LRGCRSTKVSADGFAAFDSPNFPPLGTVGIDIEIDFDRVRRVKGKRLKVKEITRPIVSALRLFPGISPELVRNVLRPPLQGLVLEAYGVGNGPDQARCHFDRFDDSDTNPDSYVVAGQLGEDALTGDAARTFLASKPLVELHVSIWCH
jgi:L-asparaginase